MIISVLQLFLEQDGVKINNIYSHAYAYAKWGQAFHWITWWDTVFTPVFHRFIRWSESTCPPLLCFHLLWHKGVSLQLTYLQGVFKCNEQMRIMLRRASREMCCNCALLVQLLQHHLGTLSLEAGWRQEVSVHFSLKPQRTLRHYLISVKLSARPTRKTTECYCFQMGDIKATLLHSHTTCNVSTYQHSLCKILSLLLCSPPRHGECCWEKGDPVWFSLSVPL